MVDIFALALSHGLLVIAIWRLLQRDDLDSDPVATAPENGEPDLAQPEVRKGSGRAGRREAPLRPAARPRRMIVPGSGDRAEGDRDA